MKLIFIVSVFISLFWITPILAQNDEDEGGRELMERMRPLRNQRFTYLGEKTYSCGGVTNTVKEYRHDQTGLEFVLIPGGTFSMGSNDGERDEKPVHTVTLSSFLISKTEVTQGVWQRIMGNNPSNFKNGDDYPVEQVSWNDCQQFCEKTGLQLPTEAQWEYAARGKTTSRWHYGDSDSNLGDYAWWINNSNFQTHPVAKKLPNAFGLYDTAGNVWEWCQDWKGDYSSSSVSNPTGPTSGSLRVSRGGCWINASGSCRSADRISNVPGDRNSSIGFRVCASSL